MYKSPDGNKMEINIIQVVKGVDLVGNPKEAITDEYVPLVRQLIDEDTRYVPDQLKENLC